MNGNGGKLIWIFGIAAAVIFAASGIGSWLTHKELLEYHNSQFRTVQTLVPAGASWGVCQDALKEKSFVVTEESPSVFLIVWNTPEESKRLQNKRLGVPLAARVELDGAGKVLSVDGVE